MPTTAAASRYARAFADVAADRKLDSTALIDQLSTFVQAMRASGELRIIWETPSVPQEQKIAVVDAIAQQYGADHLVRNFIAVLIENRRIAALPEIARQVERELNDRLGIAEAEVTTTRELSATERAQLEARLAAIIGKKVRARYAQDPAVKGGAVIKIGSTVYDGSVKGRLQRLKEQLASGEA
jgi:F-type H+-transporting ATPase subunit delta